MSAVPMDPVKYPSFDIPESDEAPIPVASEQEVVSFVVDCPSLHIVAALPYQAQYRAIYAGPDLFSFDYPETCPRCPAKQGSFRKARRISSTSELAVRTNSSIGWRQYSDLPEVVSVHPAPIDTAISSTNRPSSPPSSLRSFTRFLKSSKSSLKARPGPTLPASLSFSFCATGKSLLLWHKDANFLTQIEIATQQSCRVPLETAIRPEEADKRITIKLAAGGDKSCVAVVAYKQKRYLVFLPTTSSLSRRQLQALPDGTLTFVAASRDDRFVAVGLSHLVYLCEFNISGQLVWNIILHIEGFRKPEEVKFQVASFSTDSSVLVISTQRHDVMRSKDDDMVSTLVFRFRETTTTPTRLASCRMPTDERGLSAIFYDESFSLAFITGFIESTYPLFIHANGEATTPSKLNFKIRCAAAGPHLSHTVVFLNSKNQVYKADLRKKSFQLLGDVSKDRERLAPKEEVAGIASPDGIRAYVFWRQGDFLWLTETGGEGKKTGNRRNIRHLYDCAVEYR